LSLDVQSIQSAQSNDSGTWTTALFGNSGPKRQDSRNTREPVEMATRHDREQLPPTLSNHSRDPQEAEWNKFLLRLMKSRPRNGQDASGADMIGAAHFGKEGTAGRQKMEALVKLVLGGVPMQMRHPIWMELSNTQAVLRPNAYSYYLGLKEHNLASETTAILKDVPRTLTSKYDFYADKGYQRLKEVLVAFVGRYKDLGYTQGLNTVAGYLLLTIPSEEDAFWMLCNIVENYYPPGYFSREDAMAAPLADNVVLRHYIKELMPQLSRHLDQLGIPPDHTVPIKWFFTAFSSVLPETVVLRMWDVWLCLPNQKNFVFNVAISLLSFNVEGILRCEDEVDYHSFMDNKIAVPQPGAQLNDMIKQAYRIGKKLDHVAERRAEEAAKLKHEHRLDAKLRLKRSPSLDVLTDPDDHSDVDFRY
jgi:small G protein signaling modulator 3